MCISSTRYIPWTKHKHTLLAPLFCNMCARHWYFIQQILKTIWGNNYREKILPNLGPQFSLVSISLRPSCYTSHKWMSHWSCMAEMPLEDLWSVYNLDLGPVITRRNITWKYIRWEHDKGRIWIRYWTVAKTYIRQSKDRVYGKRKYVNQLKS